MAVVMAVLLIAILGFFAAGIMAKHWILRENPAPGARVDVGGYDMHIQIAGSGNATVVLEAGQSDFSVFWESVFPQIAAFARVCAYDRAGFGWSDVSPRGRRADVMVDELHRLLGSANISPPYVLVGHSFGALIMRLYAATYPEEVAALVLIDPAHEEMLLRIPQILDAYTLMVRQFRSLARLTSLGLPALMPAKIPNRGLTEEGLRRYRAILASTRYFQAAADEIEMAEQNYRDARERGLTDSLRDIPVTVISRARMEPLPGYGTSENESFERQWSNMQNELSAALSATEHIIAEKSGHNIHLEQPAIVVETIRKVVREISD